MAEKIQLGVNGAVGRMGQRIIALAAADPAFQVVGAYESAKHPRLGQDIGEISGIGKLGVAVTSEIGKSLDVIIDFSTPDGCLNIARQCEERRIRLVAATTGLTPAQRDEVLEVSQVTALLMAPSMSLAVNIAMKLVADAGRALRNHGSGVDVEIIERHHRYKEDAPSGTALRFGEIIAKEMGQEKHVHGREGRTGQRPRNEIGYHALRVGDNVGEHTIVFGLLGETLEVAVRGQSRDSYAQGAIAGAKFLAGRPAGLYSMNDVLGL